MYYFKTKDYLCFVSGIFNPLSGKSNSSCLQKVLHMSSSSLRGNMIKIEKYLYGISIPKNLLPLSTCFLWSMRKKGEMMWFYKNRFDIWNVTVYNPQLLFDVSWWASLISFFASDDDFYFMAVHKSTIWHALASYISI